MDKLDETSEPTRSVSQNHNDQSQNLDGNLLTVETTSYEAEHHIEEAKTPQATDPDTSIF